MKDANILQRNISLPVVYKRGVNSRSNRCSKLSITLMVQSERSTFTNKRNQQISTVAYLPENLRRPKAVLFFHHGYGEHIGRYERGKAMAIGMEQSLSQVCCYRVP